MQTLHDKADDTLGFFLSGSAIPVLEVRPDGNFYVQGRLVTNDMEVYETFKKWLEGVKEK